MQAAHRRYLVLDQGLGAVLINFALNFGIAWLAFRGMSSVPMWGAQSIAGDTIGTSFFLPFFTCLIVTPLTRHAVSSGRLPASESGRVDQSVLGRLPGRTFVRALAVGAAATLLVAPIAIFVFHSAGLGDTEAGTFMWIKASYAAVLAGLVTPLIAAGALADTGPAQKEMSKGRPTTFH